jgi:AcrR family transcriptional regulator
LVQNKSSKPRGRPRGFDPADALKAASERFRTHGFAGTSLDDLVDATGLARPSLYAAFGDKRAIYLAALDRTIDRVGKSFDTLVASDLPLRESLTAMFRFVIDGYLTGEAGPSGCIMISTSAASAVDDLAVRERLAAFLAIEDDRIEALLAARGDADPPAHARLVTAVIHSLSVRARAGASREELDAIAKACVNLIA